MANKFKILLFIIFFSNCKILYSQDIHFSQFYASPLTLNPALTGKHSANWSIMNNYRNQWGSIGIPFVTATIGFDKQLLTLKNDKLSIGGIFINDKSGDAILGVNKLYLSLAYHKNIVNQSFNLGIQAGYVIKSVNDKLTFPNQFNNNSGVFDPNIVNGESVMPEQMSYIDVNVGILWSLKIKRSELQIGMAIFHLNEPNETFFNNTNILPKRNICHVGGKFMLSDKFFLSPNAFYMNQTTANNMLVGSNIGYVLSDNKIQAQSVFIGGYYRDGFKRNSDAGVVVAGINFEKMDFGISYDINISELHKASDYQGGFEISFIYKNFSAHLKKIAIPCDRY